MMNDTEKSFACTSEECSMTLAEDYLHLHKNKHEMILNLGLNDKTTFVADQTPTPTRFIRNCEEVGLFQDLQNVNPFDETFRKAIELAESGNLHVPQASNDDTLHTPHILPHIIEENRTKLIEETDEILVSNFNVNNESSTETNLLIVNEKASDSSNKCDGTVIKSTENIGNNINADVEGKSENNLKAVKEALKNKIINESDKSKIEGTNTDQAIIIAPIKLDELQTAGGATIIIKAKPDPTICVTPRKRILKQAPTINAKKKKQTDADEGQQTKDSSDIKEKQREMNRVAQSRSRQRKKHWINEMAKKIDDLTAENKRLSSENEYLKKEIVVLNTILIHHKDCSVSKDKSASDKIKTVIEESLKRLEPKKDAMSHTKNMKPIRPYPSPNIITFVSNIKTQNDKNIIPLVVQNKPILLTTDVAVLAKNASPKI